MLADSCLFSQMWLCRGNGAQVHNSERDPQTGTAAGESAVELCRIICGNGINKNIWYLISHIQAVKVVQYNINTEELYVILKEFIHILYFR